MTKPVLLSIAVLFAAHVLMPDVLAQDFRQITWGMTVDEVKEVEEGTVLDENENMFVYAVNIAGHNALLFYKHINNRVLGGGYSFQAHHENKNEYITDYQELKEFLIDQYGSPDSDEVMWKNNVYKDRAADHGKAVGQGYLIYWADWDAGNTKIELALHGNNSLHVLAVNYASVDAVEFLDNRE